MDYTEIYDKGGFVITLNEDIISKVKTNIAKTQYARVWHKHLEFNIATKIILMQ